MIKIEPQLYQSVYPEIDVRLYTNLTAAVAAIGSTTATLLIPDAQTIAADLVIPATTTVHFLHGGTIAVGTGLTLTINGAIEAGLYRIFICSGTGKAVFGTSAKESYPEWWGAVGDGTTDDTVALNAAYDSGAGNVVIGIGTYRFTSKLSWDDYVNVRGTHMEESILLKDGNFDGIEISGNAAYSATENLYVKGQTANGGVGLLGTLAGRHKFSRLMVGYHGSHGIHQMSGNCAHYEDIVAILNGGDGIRLEDSYGFGGDGLRACWANTFINIDTRGNGGWGFNIESGSNNSGINIVSQENDGGVRINKGLTNNLEVYLEGNTTYGAVLTSNTTRNQLFIKNNDAKGYSDSGTDNWIGGIGLSWFGPQAIKRHTPGTNVAGLPLSVYGGTAGAGTTGMVGGMLNLMGGDAAGTTGDANGGAVNIYGGSPVNAGSYGNVIMQRYGGGVRIGAVTAPTYTLDITGNLQCSTGFGCNAKTPQTAYVSGGAASAGGTGATEGAYDTAAHRDGLITLVNNIRAALVANGIMS